MGTVVRAARARADPAHTPLLEQGQHGPRLVQGGRGIVAHEQAERAVVARRACLGHAAPALVLAVGDGVEHGQADGDAQPGHGGADGVHHLAEVPRAVLEPAPVAPGPAPTES